MRIIFMGSAEIAVPSLKRILDSEQDEVVAVVTQPDRPKGRRQVLSACPVKAFAEEAGLKVLTPEKVGAPESVGELSGLRPDLFVVVAYGQYIPERVLELAPHRGINMHPSLLPLYRGAAPIQWALLNGDVETGVTIIDLAAEMDAGDLYAQERVAIDPDDNAGILHDKLAVFGAGLLMRVIDLIRTGSAVRTPQDHNRAVAVRKLSRDDGQIDWSLPASELRNRVRAFNPWPSCVCKTPDGKPLKLLRVAAGEGAGVPGTVLDCSGDGPLIACGKDALRLLEVQPSGKKAMDGRSYVNGYRLQPGDRLG